MEWSSTPPHDYILVGCHDGTVALWKFSANSSCKDARPLLRFSADTTLIRGVAWAPNESDLESANVVLTASHGGFKFWDLRDPFRPLWDYPMPKIIYSLDWLSNPRCIILSFDDGILRTLSLLKAAYDVPVTGKPFKGTKLQGLHGFCCSTFAIWSVQVSRVTGMVAYCSADGAVLRFQLTTKSVDNFHKRNRTPHFLCGSLTEEQSAITINFPELDVPFPLPTIKSDSTLSIRAILTDSTQSNGGNHESAKASALENETSALCDGNESSMESESEDTLMSITSKNQTRSKCKKRVDDKAVESIDEPTVALANGNISSVPANKFDVFPPKSVAMHRVRWNMNIGSERWLCSGGAAGILRCQEIVLSDLDKKLMKKK